MLRATITSAAILFGAANAGFAGCVKFDRPSSTFYNQCPNELYVQYDTVGGGCYQSQPGAFTFEPGESRTDTTLQMTCSGDGTGKIRWAWCDYNEWRNGDCTTSFN